MSCSIYYHILYKPSQPLSPMHSPTMKTPCSASSNTLPTTNDVASPTHTAPPPEPMQQPGPLSSTPLDVTIDGDLIYSTTSPGPNTALYQTSHTLDNTHGVSLSLSRLVAPHHPGQPGADADAAAPPKFDPVNTIYDLTRVPLLSQEVELRGKRRSTLPGHITLKRGLWSWKMWHVQKGRRGLLFHATPTSAVGERGSGSGSGLWWRWKDAAGGVVATEKWEMDDGGKMRRVVAVEKGVESATRDLLVACWCAQVWAESGFVVNQRGRVGEMGRSYDLCP